MVCGSGRSGVVTMAVAQAQQELLQVIEKKLDALAQKQAGPDAVEALVQPLLANIKASSERQKQFARRLSYGLRHHYIRRYHPATTVESDDE